MGDPLLTKIRLMRRSHSQYVIEYIGFHFHTKMTTVV